MRFTHSITCTLILFEQALNSWKENLNREDVCLHNVVYEIISLGYRPNDLRIGKMKGHFVGRMKKDSIVILIVVHLYRNTQQRKGDKAVCLANFETLTKHSGNIRWRNFLESLHRNTLKLVIKVQKASVSSKLFKM